VSSQAVELLRLVAKGDERSNEHACALAAAVLADPLTQLAQAVIDGAPLAQAVRMAELILKQPTSEADERRPHVANLPIRTERGSSGDLLLRACLALRNFQTSAECGGNLAEFCNQFRKL